MCFTVQRKNPLFGKPKSVCMHRRVKQWVLWGGHWWPSSAQALPVCVYLCNICVWSDGHPEVVTRAYFTQEPHLCVWKYVYVWMTGAQRWPSMSTSSVSPASKQVRLRQSRRKNRGLLNERHNRCWRCKWKVTVWVYICLLRKEAYEKETVFEPSLEDAAREYVK